jgi:AcrR family transcriptional regulator
MSPVSTRPSTAERILDAAVPLFALHGYHGTAMDRVRSQAGVANGSLYHHFPTKADLAARLYAEGMRECRDGVLGMLASAESAERGVRAAVCWHLRWVEEHAGLARFLFADLPDEVVVAAAADPGVAAEDRRYVEVVAGWLRRHVARGELAERPFGVAHALWLGPAHEYCRHWLSGRARSRPTEVADHLADGAWRALAADR